ncbi:unnamed protein product [Brassica rapa subsp. narinosa]
MLTRDLQYMAQGVPSGMDLIWLFKVMQSDVNPHKTVSVGIHVSLTIEIRGRVMLEKAMVSNEIGSKSI